MSCWEEQAEVSDSSCKSSQLSMAHSSFQRGISAAFCTCLTIKIKSCGLWVEAVLKYLYPALSWLYHHPCFLPGWIKSGRKRVFFSCLGLSGTGGLGPSRGSQWPPSFAKCSWPCPWILQPGNVFRISVIMSDSYFVSVFLLTCKVLCFSSLSVFLVFSLDHFKHQTARRRHWLPLLMTWNFPVDYYALYFGHTE